MKKPVIFITMGDPSGVGPEIILKSLESKKIKGICTPVVIGNINVLKKTAEDLSIEHEFKTIQPHEILENSDATQLIEAGDDITDFKYGSPDKNTGKNVFSYIVNAINLCMEKKGDAIATAPINKFTLKNSNIDFNGHTEILALHSNTSQYAMMMYGKKLSIVLVTIHIPISDVAPGITTDKIYDKIILTNKSLRERFGIKSPKIAVCGLNPHAGEDGLFGNEESEIIIPALEKARKEQINVEGPLPPDTVFFKAKNGEYDAVLCMYHDQGLIPFKLLHFEDGVNTTLGLPFPRTSVDHGTAYDIAGENIANHQSMVEAILLAAGQALNMRKLN